MHTQLDITISIYNNYLSFLYFIYTEKLHIHFMYKHILYVIMAICPISLKYFNIGVFFCVLFFMLLTSTILIKSSPLEIFLQNYTKFELYKNINLQFIYYITLRRLFISLKKEIRKKSLNTFSVLFTYLICELRVKRFNWYL